MEIDETMSNDIAFTEEEKKDEVFNFDSEEGETPTDSQSESEQEDTDSTSSEYKRDDVSDSQEEEEQRVPYSRFRHVKSELDNTRLTIQELEGRLSELEQSRYESETSNEELEVPKEWVELYGDSDVSKRAYKIQLQREEQLENKAVQKALHILKEESHREEHQIAENEEAIETDLEILQDKLGRKFTPEIEDSVLSIVDEFSPTGPDGKYLSLFPFDKAYEIYELRESKKQNKTASARKKVADLTGYNSEGEVDSSDAPFKRGWDTWREEL